MHSECDVQVKLYTKLLNAWKSFIWIMSVFKTCPYVLVRTTEQQEKNPLRHTKAQVLHLTAS